MALPTHIYIGYDKSGSTWLFNALLSNPYVSLPSSKETFYFDRYYNKGLKWYSAFFSDAADVRLDISHDYIFSSESLLRIKSDLPAAKCIVFLRNPIDKLWSMYKYALRANKISGSLRDEICNDPGILTRSFYYSQVKFVLDNFPDTKFFFFEDLQSNPCAFYNDFCQYLGVPSKSSANLSLVVNPSSSLKFSSLSPFFKFGTSILRAFGAYRLIGLLKTNRYFFNFFFKSNDLLISDDDYNYLLDIFHDDISKLSSLLNIDLSHWSEYK